MIGAANGGTVAVQLELFGLNETQSKLKRFEKSVQSAMARASRATINFGKNIGGSLAKQIKAATVNFVKFAAAATAAAAAFTALNGLRRGVQNLVKLDSAAQLLNRTLGEAGPAAQQYARNLAEIYGTGITKTTQAFAKFSAAATAANVTLETQKKVFEATSKAAIAFSLTQEQTDRAFVALQQIAAKGVVSMEELRQQLGEQVPVALAATAEGLGITTKALIDLISAGELDSTTFFDAYADGMEGFTKGAESADTAARALGQFKTAWEALELTFAESLLPTIIDGMKQLTKLMNGVGTSLNAKKISGGFGEGNFALDALGFQTYGDKAVAGMQKYLTSLGYTLDQSNAMITDAVKDVKGSVYGNGFFNKGRILINNKADEDAITESLINRVVNQRMNGQGPAGQAAAVDKKIQAAQDELKAADDQAKITEAMGELEKENSKWLTKEAEKREKFLLKQVKQRVGTEAAAAYEAQEVLRRAQEDRTAAMAAYSSAMKGDLSTPEGQIAVMRAESQYSKATAENMRLAEESATAIKDAFENARENAEAAAENRNEAGANYASFLTDPKRGAGRYMSREANASRMQVGRQLLLRRAAQIKQDILPTLGAGAESFNQNTNLAAFSIQELQEFINQAGGELEAQRALVQANEELARSQNELTEVMKVASTNQVPLNESNQQLTTTIEELVSKDWVVNVEVPGGRASGDVVAMQNTLQ